MRRFPAARGSPAFALALAGVAGTAGGARAQPSYPPPPPRIRALPPPLGPHQSWVPGRWRWNGMRYVWVPAHAVWRTPHGHRWVRGRWAWAPRRGHWVWRPGHWR